VWQSPTEDTTAPMGSGARSNGRDTTITPAALAPNRPNPDPRIMHYAYAPQTTLRFGFW
jgi:hypothetical protein